MTKELLEAIVKSPVEVLNRAYRIEARVDAKNEQIRHWRELATSITLNPDNNGSGSNYPKSKIEACAIRIAELQDDIADDIAALIQTNVEIRLAIDQLCSTTLYKTVLELRYVNHLRWEEIAVRLNYTYRWTQELHTRAVADIRRQAAKALL
jgi:hypothetical protein